MANGLRYGSGRDMPPGMQLAAARQFLCNEAGAMLAVLQKVDVDCEFCINAWREAPCEDSLQYEDCATCGEQMCPCCACVDKSKYQWCGAEEAMRRLEQVKK